LLAHRDTGALAALGGHGTLAATLAAAWAAALAGGSIACLRIGAGPDAAPPRQWHAASLGCALAQALAGGSIAALAMPDGAAGQVASVALLVGLFASTPPRAAEPPAGTWLRAAAALSPAVAVLLVRGDTAAGAIAAVGTGAVAWLAARRARASRRRSTIRALQQRVAGLEEDAARATRDAEQARARAREAQEAATRARHDRTRFLATASHDLRQPVHAIGLFVGALREEVRDGRARQLVDRLDRSMSGLDELFNRLLEISRLDAGTIDPRPSVFPVGPVLQTLETRFAAVAQQRGLSFRVRSPAGVNVRSDAALLSEMLMNLLSNAIRYTQRGGVLLGARRRGDRLLVQVWDTGPGIAPRDLDRVFEEFVQLGPAGPGRRQGLGLGLAIVQRLARALECPVSVRSRVGRGSVFEVSVPIGRDPAPARAVEPAAMAASRDDSLHGMLVLVVDDEIDVLVGMEAILSAWGCYVLLARSAQEAARHLDEALRFPDVLITDHLLGRGQTSADVVAMLARSVPVPIPVVVVSGESGPELASLTRSRGWDVLAKPVNPERLRELLVRLLAGGG
jgi:signal transduction histidine kinase